MKMGELASRGSVASSVAARLLLLSLAVVLALLGHAGAASVCDTADCGKGNCSETSAPIIPLAPNYECHCDTGWSHALKPILFSPCIIPNCSFNSACLNLTLSPPPWPPKGIPIPDVCSVVSCGAGGACKAGAAPFSYTCQCNPGYSNLLNRTELPCVNCFLGEECHALGLGPAAPAPVPAPGPPAPSGDHGSSPPGTSAPPSGTKGSVSSPSLVQLLLMLVSAVAMLQVV